MIIFCLESVVRKMLAISFGRNVLIHALIAYWHFTPKEYTSHIGLTPHKSYIDVIGIRSHNWRTANIQTWSSYAALFKFYRIIYIAK